MLQIPFNAEVGKKSKYDESPSMLRCVFSWDGTVLEGIVKSPDFWFFILVYVIFVAVNLYWVKDSSIRFSTMDLGPMANLTVFFLVFFNGHCYVRYWAQYTNNMNCLHNLREVNYMLFGIAKPEMVPATIHCARYLQAAHVLSFMHLSSGYRDGSVASISYNQMTEFGLLTTEEVTFLEGIKQGCTLPSITCVMWSMKVLTQLESQIPIPPPTTAMIRSKIGAISQSIATLYDYQHCYIPYTYFHILNMCSVAYLSAFTYVSGARAIYDHAFGSQFVSQVFICFCLVGLRNISTQMIFAYGNDKSDLPGVKFINRGLEEFHSILSNHFDPVWSRSHVPTAMRS